MWNENRRLFDLAPPLDSRAFLTFRQVAASMARRDPTISYLDALEKLTIAMWRGDFNSPRQATDANRSSIEWWIAIVIYLPAVEMTDAQIGMTVRPSRYYVSSRYSALSVMNSFEGLPGRQSYWSPMVQSRSTDHLPFELLVGLSISTYPERGIQYLETIAIERTKLFRWLALHS